MNDANSEWSRKGATLSDKSARKEFGLTQPQILAAIQANKLQYRQSNMHGNPWLRLLRNEVETLVGERSGPEHLRKKLLQKELSAIIKESRKLKARLKVLEQRQDELSKQLDE